MAANSKVNPNFPIPGLDQSSKGFRDNFSTIKTELESLQNKTLVFTGALAGTPNVILDSGAAPVVVDAVINTNFGNLGIDEYGQVYSIIPNAVGDGVTDDTVAINAYLSGLPTGATVILQTGKTFLISSGNLIVPDGVSITANGSPFVYTAAYTLEPMTGFILAPAYTIMLGNGSTIDNLFIRSNLLTANPDAITATSIVYTWFTNGGTGITIPANANGVRVTRCFIVGFNIAVRAYAGDFVCHDLWIDSYNGIEVSHPAGDNYYVHRVRCEPWYSLNTLATSGSWDRSGIAFYIHDGAPGGYWDNVFAFMWRYGFVLANAGVTTIEGSGVEYQSSFGPGVTATTGIRWVGHNAETALYNSYLNGFATPASVEGVGATIMSDVYIPTATSTGVYLIGNTGTPQTITITGTPIAGDTVTVVLTSAALTGGSITIVYTVKPGDSLNSIAANIADAFVRQYITVEAQIYVTAWNEGMGDYSNVLTVYFPVDISVTAAGYTTGTLTATNGTGVARTGSYGAIRGINFEFNNVPLVTAGGVNGIVNTWQISFNNAAVPLFNDWLLIQNLHTASSINLSGIVWNVGASLTGGGTGAFVTGNDACGTIKMGAGPVTSVTLNFAVPFPWQPRSITATTSTTTVSLAVTAFSNTSVTFTASGNIGGQYIYYTIQP